MQVRAIAKNQRVQPRKVRIIADEVRGKGALHAAALLRYHPSKSARVLRKVLVSAIANAEANNNLSAETLKISTIMVDEGPRLKRIQARAMGRANRIVKKTSHITVLLEEDEVTSGVKPANSTKAKPRPTFAVKKGKKAAKPAETPVAEVVEEKVEEVVEAAPEAPVEENVTPEASAEATAQEETK